MSPSLVEPLNPPGNKLPAGLSEAQLNEAVGQSGYPLQLLIAAELRARNLWVEEEWSYVDRNTGELRALDLFAERPLWDLEKPQPRVTATLKLLVECKRSDLPFVFFRAQKPHHFTRYPLIGGLPKDDLTVHTDDDPSIWSFSILECLDLMNHPFIVGPSTFSNTFSKVERNKKVVLSGSTVFNEVVMPIITSLEHYLVGDHRQRAVTITHGEERIYWACDALLTVAVLDAPMVVATVEPASTTIEFAPWVRITRQEARIKGPEGHGPFAEPRKFYGLDIVHKEFFAAYLDSYVLPFANAFSEQVAKHQVELASCEGFVPGFGKRSWPRDIESLLRPV